MKRIEWREVNSASAFYILLLAGFILISCLPYFLSAESRIVTVPFRALVLGVSLFLICKTLLKKIKYRLDFYTGAYIFFWIIYIINVYVSFHNYQFSEDFKAKENEIYIRIIGVCFLPSLAILVLKNEKINYSYVFNAVYFAIYIVLLLNIIVGIEYDHQGRSSGILSMYSINFGHVGVSLAILSLYQLVVKKIVSSYYIWFMVSGVVLGTYILYASATRGPLVAYVLCIVTVLFLKRKYNYLVILSIIFLLSSASSITFKLNESAAGENGFFKRVANMIISGDSSGRGKLYSDALSIFVEKPIFGGRFLFFDGVYAHNIFLDVLMSMGIVGMFIFVLFFKECVSQVWQLFQRKDALENESSWIHLLYIQYLAFAFFSCSLFDTPEFWYLTAMLMVLNKKKKTE